MDKDNFNLINEFCRNYEQGKINDDNLFELFIALSDLLPELVESLEKPRKQEQVGKTMLKFLNNKKDNKRGRPKISLQEKVGRIEWVKYFQTLRRDGKHYEVALEETAEKYFKSPELIESEVLRYKGSINRLGISEDLLKMAVASIKPNLDPFTESMQKQNDKIKRSFRKSPLYKINNQLSVQPKNKK